VDSAFAKIRGYSLLQLLNNRWVRLALLATSLGVAFVAGAGALFAAKNMDRIKTRFIGQEVMEFSDTELSNWTRFETGLVTVERAKIRLGDTGPVTLSFRP